MKYQIILTRDATESAVLEVEADSEDQAREQATEQVGKYGDGMTLDWELDEGNFNEVYVTNVEPVS